MRSPSINELPPPPLGKTGWPWTAESPALPAKMDDGSLWPRISIVTPSLNQGQFIEETIRSVLLQGYPKLEYIIIDGGSRDGSVDIIKKYEPWLVHWVSELDRGQSHAINKGIKMLKGEIFAWINSDDIYLPNAFGKVTLQMWQADSLKVSVLVGNCYAIDDKSKIIGELISQIRRRIDLITYWRSNTIYQQSVFISTSLMKKCLLDESLICAFDKDLWIRLMEDNKFVHSPDSLSCFRAHGEAKSSMLGSIFERERRNLTIKYKKTRLDWHVYFIISFSLTQIRYFYHIILRKHLLKVLFKIIGERKYDEIRNFKKTHLGFLSRIFR